LTEWLFEAVPGSARALLIDGGSVIEALLELDDGRLRNGAVVEARWGERRSAGRWQAITKTNGEVLVSAARDVAQGERVLIEITREPILERGRWRPAQGVVSELQPRPGPSLHDRLEASGMAVRTVEHGGPDLLGAAGWSDLIEEARDGRIGFAGGELLMAVTPAMTLFDVDGDLAPEDLAIAGARAAAVAIRRHGVAGSIGIDLPTLPAKAARQAAADALDAVLPPPFERTAVNGFGFLQVVRRRVRASLPELCTWRTEEVAAVEVVRAAMRTSGAGRRTITCHPRVAVHVTPAIRAGLQVCTGYAFDLKEDARLPYWSGHVQAEHP
jgi:hypothetical protein